MSEAIDHLTVITQRLHRLPLDSFPPKQILARTANKLPGHIVYVPLLMSELHMFVFMLRTPLNTYFLLMWAHSLFRLVFPSPLPLLYILPAFII